MRVGSIAQFEVGPAKGAACGPARLPNCREVPAAAARGDQAATNEYSDTVQNFVIPSTLVSRRGLGLGLFAIL